MACIRNASINIINSVFKHNFANYHAGVFYIDESVTTVDGSLFVNNSAAVDGGVFYTYVHASDYIIRRSQFSENTAGDDGGIVFIGRLNSFVSIDESIFDFNSAVDRGGVIALIASSIFMEINRTNVFNNTAEYGGVMSACNSQVTLFDDYLFVTVDPLLSFCKLYEEDVRHYNITSPQEPEIAIATAPPTTTAPFTTTNSPTSLPPTTESPSTMAPPTTNKRPPSPITMSLHTTSELITTFAQSTTTDHEPQTIMVSPSTTDLSTFTEIEVDNREGTAGYKLSIVIAICAVALTVSLIAIVVVLVRELLQCISKNGTNSKKVTFTPEFPEMTEFRKGSLNSFHAHPGSESSVYDKSSEEKEQDLCK